MYKESLAKADNIPDDDKPIDSSKDPNAADTDNFKADVNTNEEKAGEEYMIWEPSGLSQNIKNMLWNMMEV